MFRQPAPFPTSPARRPRSPSQLNGYDAESTTPFPSSTRPLQIGRPSSRSHTPSNSSLMSDSPRGQTTGSPSAPSRPQRSELRSRQMSEYSDQTSGSSRSRPTQDRDSVSTTRSDASLGNSYSKRNGVTTQLNARQQKPKRSGSAEVSPLSPSSMAAITAFQNAGQRKRAQTNGSDDVEYEKEKRMEREKEMLMQQRIREKAPGRRTNGKARAGDIDGRSLDHFPRNIIYTRFDVYSCAGPNQGRLGLCY